MSLHQGDRVRVRNPISEYTGCRGTIVDTASGQPARVTALGHFVAIDGENGRTRAFLLDDLELLQAVRVRGRSDRDEIREVADRAPRTGD
jgi:IS4 transposase